MNEYLDKAIEILSRYVTPQRLQKIERVLQNRTRNVVLVVEDIHEPHNVSACIRTAESFGIQEFHVICSKEGFSPSQKVTQGAHKWVDIFRYKDSLECIQGLKKRGYTIAAAIPSPECKPLYSLDFTKPIALCFGNEHEGLSKAIVDNADVHFVIPMFGFSQSLNISVAAAVTLFYAVTTRFRLLGKTGDLSEEDKKVLKLQWLKKSVHNADLILQRELQELDEPTVEIDPDEFEKTVADVNFSLDPCDEATEE